MRTQVPKNLWNRTGCPRIRLALIALAASLAIAACPSGRRAEPPAAQRVKAGVEVFLEKHLDLVQGKKVGLITNPTGTDGGLRSTVDLLIGRPEVNLVALYGPEHGVRGDAQAGVYVPFYKDQKYNLPVFSLYGQSMKLEPGMLKNIDEYMRSFDTRSDGKSPEEAMVRGIDVMIYDIQDVGTRVFTYIATMAFAMQACAEAGIEFIVLDRPNPINGVDMEGPILEAPKFSSFIGLYPIPERFGMTMGELARLFNDRFLVRKAKLEVVPMEGWKRTMWFDQSGLPWVIPSPNMPTLETATVYPGQVSLEGTNLSEGRGTTKPFELFGAPWVDGHELAARLNTLAIPGAAFREAWFTPTFSKFQGQLCGGCQVHVTNRDSYRSFETALHIIKAVRDMYPDKFEFYRDYFDKVMGTSGVREALETGRSVRAIVDGLRPGLASFAELRKPYLLY
jgi:uncharacterized protein YbbC (DUF1343 family)